jgi:hypothetical protein
VNARGRRIRGLFCEALRESGILVLVFASLDGAFNAVPVTRWTVVVWGASGAMLLLLGIFLDPEVVG